MPALPGSPHCICRRSLWSDHALDQVATKLKANDEVHVRWYDETYQSLLWKGIVHDINPVTVHWYDESDHYKGLLNFPPDRQYARYTRLIVRRPPTTPTFQAPPGIRINVTFTKGGRTQRWTGTVIASIRNNHQLVVKYDNGLKLLFPPPPSANTTVHHYSLFDRPLNANRMRQQQLRYRSAAAFVAQFAALPRAQPARPRTGPGLEAHGPQNHAPPHNTQPQQQSQERASSQPSTQEHDNTIPDPPKNKRSYMKRGYRAATFNARTMTDEFRWERTVAYMDLRGIDILCVQETRCAELIEHHRLGTNIIHTPAKDGHHGCALLTGPRVDVLTAETIAQHRAIKAHVRIKITKGLHIDRTVIAAYFPQREDPEQQTFLELIQGAADNQTILLCDANGAGSEMENQANLKSCARVVGNIKWTWKGHNSSSHIDHVLLSSQIARETRHVTYEQPLRSDHRMVTASLLPKFTKRTDDKPKKIELHDLGWCGEARRQFNDAYEPVHVYSLEDMKRHIGRVEGDFFTKKKVQPKPWTRRGCAESVLNSRDDTENRLERAEEDFSTEELEEYVLQLQHNPWTAWKHVNTIERQDARVTGAVTAAQLRDFFKNSMESQANTTGDPDIHVPDAHLVNISQADFTIDELKIALQSMKNHTAAGPDGIPIEAYRCPNVQSDLLKVLNSTLDAEELPSLLTNATLTPIYKKKGSAKEPVNYRPIVLMSVALKILHKMILLRLRNQIDKHLIPTQAAYRLGHATTLNMVALQELVERSRTSKDTPLYIVFTDFTAAFDSVHRPHLFHLLRKWNVPERLVKFIERSHAQQTLNVRFDGTVDPVATTPAKGVMQGDTLAPYLFIMVIDQILRQLPDKGALVKKGGTRSRPNDNRVDNLAYADDVALLANSISDAQALLTSFEQAALTWGLHLNTKKGKTEVLVIANKDLRDKLPPPRLTCTAGDVQETDSYKYLGWHISNSPMNGWQQDFKKRTQHAWSVLHKHDRIWRSQAPRHIKQRLFQALIMPVLTYAAMTYPLTQTVLLKLQVATNKLLRSALGLRIEWGNPELHTHTEGLYNLFPFTPVSVVRMFMVQWGHWCRAAERNGSSHPIVDVFLSPFSHVKPSRHVAHNPSKWLLKISGLTKEELYTLPQDRKAYRLLCEARTKGMARDFCNGPVTHRRLEDGCSLPDWSALIEHWFDESRSRRKKEFF